MSLGDIPHVGALAGLLTALFWALCSLALAQAGRSIGSLAVNQIRILMAVVLLSILHALLLGGFWPDGIPWKNLALLAASGICGLTFGDLCLFKCFVILGPRLSHLIMASAPVITVLMAWPLLDESLTVVMILGVMLTVGGVAWGLVDRGTINAWQAPHGSRAFGILMGLLGALGQAVGLILAKPGMQALTPGAESVDPLAATLVRMVAAAAAIVLFAGVAGHARTTLRSFKNTRAIFLTFVGAVLGPTLGVWLSLISVRYTHTGIAATMMATTPIITIPLVRIFYNERVSRTAILGTFVAVVGTAILFLSSD